MNEILHEGDISSMDHMKYKTFYKPVMSDWTVSTSEFHTRFSKLLKLTGFNCRFNIVKDSKHNYTVMTQHNEPFAI